MLAVVSQHVGRTPSGWSTYLLQSRRPLASFVFVGPLLLAYEFGAMLVGGDGGRGSVDEWLRTALGIIGLGRFFFLPILTVVVLLAWHHSSRQRWQLSVWVPLGMFAESLAWAALLVGVARFPAWIFFNPSLAVHQGLAADIGFGQSLAVFQTVVGALGAGVYEELVFRLLMLPVVMTAMRRAGLSATTSTAAAVLITSAVFAAAHFFGPFGDTWQTARFGIRFAAGIFFAAVFLRRGFGVVVGTHAAYDLLVQWP